MVQRKMKRPEAAGRLAEKLKDLKREQRDLEGRIERAFIHDDYESLTRRLRSVKKEIAELREVLD